MGTRTDVEIARWQEKAGIEPATGERAEILRKLSDAAFEAIKIIELERSGIRDGDGCWHGSDVIGHVTSDLIGLCNALMRDDDPRGFTISRDRPRRPPGGRVFKSSTANKSWRRRRSPGRV